MSHVLEHAIQDPVTHWGPAVGGEGPSAATGPLIKAGRVKEDIVVLEVVEVVPVVLDVVVVLCDCVNFGANSCCGDVTRGMRKL